MAPLEPCNTHDDLVPGTIHLVQQEQLHVNSKHDIVLVPAPSTDPSDPLVSLRLKASAQHSLTSAAMVEMA